MVKRTSSIPRTRADISDEVAQAFRQALKLRDHRETQLADGKACEGIGACSICNEYERLVRVVDAALDLKPHQLSPIDVFDASAPPMWPADKQADWDRARVQHVALAKAAGIKPRAKGLLTDACRGQVCIRWIERAAKIPDGPTVGQPFRLLEFQREVIRGIYGDPSYWQAVDLVLKKRRAA